MYGLQHIFLVSLVLVLVLFCMHVAVRLCLTWKVETVWSPFFFFFWSPLIYTVEGVALT